MIKCHSLLVLQNQIAVKKLNTCTSTWWWWICLFCTASSQLQVPELLPWLPLPGQRHKLHNYLAYPISSLKYLCPNLSKLCCRRRTRQCDPCEGTVFILCIHSWQSFRQVLHTRWGETFGHRVFFHHLSSHTTETSVQARHAYKVNLACVGEDDGVVCQAPLKQPIGRSTASCSPYNWMILWEVYKSAWFPKRWTR
jgi:hypothetical protein